MRQEPIALLVAVLLFVVCRAIRTEALDYGETAAGYGQAQPQPLKKVVSEQANFVTYLPAGWKCTESAQPTFRVLILSDATGMLETATFHGTSPTGNDLVALARNFMHGIGQQFPDLQIVQAATSPDRSKIAVSATFTHAQKGRREFHCWLMGEGPVFTYLSVETPANAYAANRQLLLTILSNIRVTKGSYGPPGPAPIQVQLAEHRLRDGSASFLMPRDWQVREVGAGQFIAADATARFSFMALAAEVVTPALGVRVPNVPVSPYLRPAPAMKFLAESSGIASNLRCIGVLRREELEQQMAQVYTAGPVTVEDFLYTCTAREGHAVKAYTMGFSFGTRLNTNWTLRHMTVAAPADQFDAFVPNFVAMLQSYKIDNQWAANYVQQGLVRLRELQRQTSALIARNAREIREVMTAAYEERQRSMDYIDYQRSSYIRGTQDWVSAQEGGRVYHTDGWGTRNAGTGESWQGQPYDYIHFQGRDPRTGEGLTPINSRELWERHVK